MNLSQELEESNAPRIRCVKVGDIIKVMEQDELFSKRRKVVKYRVTEVHSFLVRAAAVHNQDIVRCFSYGDLIMLGKEKQSPGLEALRHLTEWEREKMEELHRCNQKEDI